MMTKSLSQSNFQTNPSILCFFSTVVGFGIGLNSCTSPVILNTHATLSRGFSVSLSLSLSAVAASALSLHFLMPVCSSMMMLSMFSLPCLSLHSNLPTCMQENQGSRLTFITTVQPSPKRILAYQIECSPSQNQNVGIWSNNVYYLYLPEVLAVLQ